MKQLHECGTFKPLLRDKLASTQKNKTLLLLIFLKEKRDGRIKERACADKRRQHSKVNKEEVAFPTAAVESVILTCSD
eukprot:8431858-Ditylum_brightwellii.AAC.1